jgi:hypothetical protein
MTQNLQKIEMHLPSHNSKQEYLEEFGHIMRDLIQEAENPWNSLLEIVLPYLLDKE